jgi:hypothetical protein
MQCSPSCQLSTGVFKAVAFFEWVCEWFASWTDEITPVYLEPRAVDIRCKNQARSCLHNYNDAHRAMRKET